MRTLLVEGIHCSVRVTPHMMGSAPPIRNPCQGLNRSSHLCESSKSDALTPHGSAPPGPPATDSRRHRPYRWCSSRVETSTVGSSHCARTPSIECCSPQHKCYAPPSRKFFGGGVSCTLCGPKTDTRFFNPGTEVGLGIGPDTGGSFGGRNASKIFNAPASPFRRTFRATTYYGTISALLNIPSV